MAANAGDSHPFDESTSTHAWTTLKLRSAASLHGTNLDKSLRAHKHTLCILLQLGGKLHT